MEANGLVQPSSTTLFAEIRSLQVRIRGNGQTVSLCTTAKVKICPLGEQNSDPQVVEAAALTAHELEKKSVPNFTSVFLKKFPAKSC